MRVLRSRHRRSAALILVAASLHACSDSTGPDDGPPLTLSQVMLEASDPLLTELASGVFMAPISLTSVSRFTAGGCNHDAASQSFVCPTVSSGGLSFERSFVLFDAAGSRQSQFSATTTAAVQMKMRVSGTMMSSNSRLTLEETDERTVSGLLTARHVLNGTSAMTMSGTFATPGAKAEPISMTSTTKTENLVLPSRSNRWPGPGTMTTEATSAFGTYIDSELVTRMKVTFTGTKCATIAISYENEVETYTIDLSNPNATSCRP